MQYLYEVGYGIDIIDKAIIVPNSDVFMVP
jgi:hypothetical protein